ncbi:hypothetical protein SKAU_G00227100 [Synaphobranchus kaupii]|uniref:GP-PDE domain-containing protein n=1 Tax=Synaphobranchus kaupii TaxID=118154 RepID=A0A9Q1ISW8_SYNKA|nr:hypothetical protein SKAU_G00227100 [Synaphobranchus kaupii]
MRIGTEMPEQDWACQKCCRGLYSCYWGQRSNRKQRFACFWFAIVSLVSLLALFWMYVCLVALNDHDDVNWKAFSLLMKWINWFNWFMVMVIISALLTIYCCLLLLFALFQVALGEPLDLHWLHKALLFLVVIVIAVGITGISTMWEREWATVRLSLQATAPFLQLGAVVALTLLSWLVFQRVLMTRSAVSRRLTLLLFVVVSIAIFLCPLFITSPCLLEKLPPRPALVGHRGAPMLAPENTMMSFRRGVECGLIAFETDVQLSKNGVPFLLHDNKGQFLLRTTNVNEVYKDQKYYSSSQVTWKELQTLNAGKWFIKSDPFGTVASLSEQEVAEAQNQSLPALSELLELAKEHNVSVVFDMKNDSPDSNDTHHTVQAILRSNISADLVLWLPPIHRAYVKKTAPGFRHVYADATKMFNESGNQLNIRYSELGTEQIHELKSRNISVNLWVVNEPWLFSLLWCSGASSVTTNACHRFKDMTEPVWRLSPSTYKIIWISVDVGSLVVMMAIFLLQRKLESRDRTVRRNENELHPFLHE